jgi:hypothetical protein
MLLYLAAYGVTVQLRPQETSGFGIMPDHLFGRYEQKPDFSFARKQEGSVSPEAAIISILGYVLAAAGEAPGVVTLQLLGILHGYRIHTHCCSGVYNK